MVPHNILAALVAALSLASLAAVPAQLGQALGIPWWVWLVVISVLLLLAFAIILFFDWGDAAGREQNGDE
ncbi:MAG TPA: hypothetical protein VK879_21580 [Candidatus Sulfomarinibacteraceae bacterium]|nr:hypothetical protein [Candidatus Sulfomarinibacteraceae bacterium]